jgi:hypothetical protein
MIMIGEAIVEEAVATAQFACDVSVCKGACCTLPGGRGAPLATSEVAEIERALPAVLPYLPERHRREIALHGAVEFANGTHATRCVDERACVFVWYDGDIARCALEKAHEDGLTSWKKPISCWLFPVRVSAGPRPTVRYEEIPECAAGRRRGRSEHVRLPDFVRGALVERFGERWYDEFRSVPDAYASALRDSSDTP